MKYLLGAKAIVVLNKRTVNQIKKQEHRYAQNKTFITSI